MNGDTEKLCVVVFLHSISWNQSRAVMANLLGLACQEFGKCLTILLAVLTYRHTPNKRKTILYTFIYNSTHNFFT